MWSIKVAVPVTTRRSERVTSARELAADILVAALSGRGFVSSMLDAALDASNLSERDRALATELVYGTLRTRDPLDRLLSGLCRKPLKKLEPLAYAVLLVGSYELLHHRETPTRAVIFEAVSQMKRRRNPALANLVNAVLRRMAAETAQASDEPTPDVLSVPDWLVQSLVSSLGRQRYETFVTSLSRTPPLTLRTNLWRSSRAELMEMLRQELQTKADCRSSAITPTAVYVRGAGDIRRTRAYADGLLSVQDEASQVVSQLVDAQPGERVADMCAGHGGKTVWLAHKVAPQGHVSAFDIRSEKLEALSAERHRLGLAEDLVSTARMDLLRVDLLRDPPKERFDRVLVDAPCSGSGTLRRKPELLRRLTPDRLTQLADQQLHLLTQAARCVRPGGLLLYAVCSLTAEEGLHVVQQFEQSHRGAARCDLPHSKTVRPDADGLIRLGPWVAEGMDGHQLVGWQVS